MTGSGGRHSSSEDRFPSSAGDRGAPRYAPSRYEVPPYDTGGFEPVGRESSAGAVRVPRVLDRYGDRTGPLVVPHWWSYGSSDHPDHPMRARNSGDSRGWGRDELPPSHPSAPLPPRPPGVWDKLHPRQDTVGDDAPTVAQPLRPGAPLDRAGHRGQTSGTVDGSHRFDGSPRFDEDTDDGWHDDAATEAHVPDLGERHAFTDGTGGLEVLDTHVEAGARRRRGRRGRRRRSPVAVVLSLLVLAGLVVGIVLGGQQLIAMVVPPAKDYTGQGTGAISVRVQDGDTLSDIGRTLVEADVIAAVGPFVDAAENNAAAVGIQPGVYAMRLQMSGRAALDQLLDPAARLLSRVTVPEGLTVAQTLTRLAEETGRPVTDYQAAATDTTALGLPAYANGQLEGFLFPATYDVEPDMKAADILRQMVARSTEVLAGLGIPEADRLPVVTKASLVQAEAGSVEDMGKVARVLANRIADGMRLQLDTTVNYANGKGGITTSPADRANPSPYNTYLYPGLPPGAIGNPGEDALRAVLNPTPGDWRFFVVVNPDTGDTRFAVTGAEHQQNVLLFQQWLRANPGG